MGSRADIIAGANGQHSLPKTEQHYWVNLIYQSESLSDAAPKPLSRLRDVLPEWPANETETLSEISEAHAHEWDVLDPKDTLKRKRQEGVPAHEDGAAKRIITAAVVRFIDVSREHVDLAIKLTHTAEQVQISRDPLRNC
ncbi:uncharacterized protein RHO25_006701 [Cercospora beticola]|uniref:Uncharacterized protein n=1 Tax=Cercospora beticola TaxID=122368 RepID=A0ABZ0NR55_CERBT|nr:hypothetical protein RHO25_006701 [Cercospora beticola]